MVTQLSRCAVSWWYGMSMVTMSMVTVSMVTVSWWYGYYVNGYSTIQVFCVHGGIPMPDLMGPASMSAINDVPTILSDPLEQSPLAWDLLWNDPIR